MGTKGSKNTPITARINTGLFNQKKGVREPLLDVGPAGVYGNNQTQDIPSPSKMRGYSQVSPLKQALSDEKPIQAVLGSKSAGTQIIEQGELIPKEASTNRVEKGSKEEDFYNKNKTRCDKLTNEQKLDPKNKCTGFAQERKPDKVTNVPGKDTIKLEDLEKKGNRGINESWEVGSQGRRMKRLSDDISDQEKKAGRYSDRRAKYGTQDADGNWTAKKGSEKKFRRATSNLDEANRNIEGSRGQYETYSKGVARGASGYHNDTFSVKEKATIGSVSNDINEQVDFLKKNNGDTTDPTDTATNPASTKKDVDSAAEMNSKFFKKKTPLKMKYFK